MSYPSSLQRYSTAADELWVVDEASSTKKKRCVKDIWRAAIEGDVECLRANISIGVDVNALGQPAAVWGPRFEKSSMFSATPLHYACSYGREEAVTFLLQSGARAELRSASGHTAKDYARKRNYLAILHQLDMHMLKAAAAGQLL